jgi:uncharacterized protein involved in type VI secretion and phage assembly
VEQPDAMEATMDERAASGLGGRWYGVYPAQVRDLRDPDGRGRVKVALPWSPDAGGAGYEAWARLATLAAGNNRGTWWVPDVDDEVLVAFEGGDPRRPYVLGVLWNGVDAPPAAMDGSGQNDLKVIRSRNGLKVTLDDADGRESITIETPGGRKLSLTDGPGALELTDGQGNSLKMEASGVTLTATTLTINAGAKMDVSAGMVSVNAGMSKFSGVVKSDTVITNTTVSATYTPGAGNIW